MTRGVAAFDFDGTITRRDTLVAFLTRQRRASMLTASLAGALHSVRSGAGFRDDVKKRVVRALFGGRPAADVARSGAEYAAELPGLYRPATLERIDWHRSQGHELVLVTGSLGVYARPAGEALGFDHVIAVELEADPTGTLTGALVGANVRRHEKEHRLRAHLGDDPVELWAYGNSSGDLHLLAMADHPTWVGRRARRNRPN